MEAKGASEQDKFYYDPELPEEVAASFHDEVGPTETSSPGSQIAMEESSEKKAIESELEWMGVLTIENTKWIADRMQRLLTGKKYVSVTVNEADGFKPVIHMNQRLTDPITDYRKYIGDIEITGFRLSDSHEWTFSTCIPSTHLYKNLPTIDDEMYFHFEYNKVCVTRRAPAGHRLYWLFSCIEEQWKRKDIT
jgi:hypothetical protein